MAFYSSKMGVWNGSQTMWDLFQNSNFNAKNLPFIISRTLTCVCICMHKFCIRMHKACVCRAWACVCMHEFQKLWKASFSALKLGFGTNPTLSRSRFKASFSNYKKPYMVPFQDTQKILRKNIRFTRNSESKREFFTKHPQVNICLIRTYSGLDLRISRFVN